MLTDKQKELIINLNSVKSSTKTRTEYNAYHQMLTRIRKFGHDAIDDLKFLTEELPEDRLKKLFTDDRIEDLFKITEKALEVAASNLDNLPPGIKKRAYNLGLSIFKYIMPEPYYQLVYKFISDPEHYEKLVSEHTVLYVNVSDLKERLAAAENMLSKCNLTKDDLDKEVYTQHNAKIIKNLEKHVEEGELTNEQIQSAMENLKMSWEDHKKCRLDTANWLKSIGQ